MDPTENKDIQTSSNKLPPLYPKLPALNPPDSHQLLLPDIYDTEAEIRPILPESHGKNIKPLPPLIKPAEPPRNEWQPLPPLRYKPPVTADDNILQPTTTTNRSEHTIAVGKHRTWLIWSIISAIIFMPIFFLWIPALVCSFQSRKLFKHDIVGGKKFAKFSLFLNITCLIFGLVCYLAAIIILAVLLTKSKATVSKVYSCSSIDCYDYCRVENSAYWYGGIIYNSYWTCYTNLADYISYQNDKRYLFCKVVEIEGDLMYVCQNEKF